MTACVVCETPLPRIPCCEKCGSWNPSAGNSEIAKLVNDEDIVASTIRRLDVGEPFNEVWGGGIVPGSVSLVSGPPGGAKSTLLSQVGGKLAELSGKRCIYISAEQSPGEVKMFHDRLGLAGRFRLLSTYGGGGAVSDEDLAQSCAVILDSVTSLTGPKDIHAAVAVAKRYKAYAVKFQIPVFLIAHMTKDGMMAGSGGLQHEVDVLIGVEPKLTGSNRVIEPFKNRFGPSFVKYEVAMSPTGLVPLPPKEPKPKKKASKKSSKKKKHG